MKYIITAFLSTFFVIFVNKWSRISFNISYRIYNITMLWFWLFMAIIFWDIHDITIIKDFLQGVSSYVELYICLCGIYINIDACDIILYITLRIIQFKILPNSAFDPYNHMYNINHRIQLYIFYIMGLILYTLNMF